MKKNFFHSFSFVRKIDVLKSLLWALAIGLITFGVVTGIFGINIHSITFSIGVSLLVFVLTFDN